MSQVLVHVVNTKGVVTTTRTGQEMTYPVTTFDNFLFNSFAEINGKYYAAGAEGLVQIDVEDAPQPLVPWSFATGWQDFGSVQQKRVSDFYMAMRSKGNIVLEVAVDEGEFYEYPLKPLDIETLNQRRSLVGKGLRGRYWKFRLSGDADFDFDSFMVSMANTSRRV